MYFVYDFILNKINKAHRLGTKLHFLSPEYGSLQCETTASVSCLRLLNGYRLTGNR